ncbi:hypothetical protein TD95_003147 [Thielaviopsis punctulata]|uniref:Major facilitator superfamily (MFS) profile domain-containing protein n=1 Tax=Thielaviopsis punctulata TaxID=72032 RepID=A0A0F4ZAB8_9PEZI|nr:hypothetical protein TD95_003147 [Thielaviopsis punctulata]
MSETPVEKTLVGSSSDDDSLRRKSETPLSTTPHQHHVLPASIIAAEVTPGSAVQPAAETDSDTDSESNHSPAQTAGHDDIPDGGLNAWFQCFASWVLLVDTWGVINCFGVYQTFYERGTLFERSPSDLAWIGSIQSALLLIIGSVVGPLYDAGYFRIMMRSGIFLIVLGQFMVSLCHTYWQVFLAQGLCIGLGSGLAFLPSTAILSQYFKKRLGLAIGFSAAGSPVAGIIFPIMFGHLEPRIGFAWATRAIAFVLLGLSAIPLAFMKTRVTPTKRPYEFKLIKDIARDLPFLFAALGMALVFMTMYVPYFYIQAYAINKGITTKGFSPYLITIMSAGSVPGRIIPNHIGDKVGPLNVLIVLALACMILAFSWMSITSMGSLVVFLILYGCASGGLVSGAASMVIAMAPDLSVIGVRMGFMYTFAGLATLVGPPVAGAIIGDSGEHRNWIPGIGWSGAGLALGLGMLVTGRTLHYRWHHTKCI